jgi:hypothetical protein
MGGSRYPSAKYLLGSSPAPEKPLRVYKDKIDGPLTKTSVGLYGGTLDSSSGGRSVCHQMWTQPGTFPEKNE